MTIEDVLKVVSVVLVPSIAAVVWLLREVYGLRSDLRALAQDQKNQCSRIHDLERSVEKLASSVQDLTLILARRGLDSKDGTNHG